MKIYKFKTSHCVQCIGLNERMKSFDTIPVVTIDCEDDEAIDLVDKFKIKNVPTLILVDENENELHRWGNVSSINELNEVINEFKSKREA